MGSGDRAAFYGVPESRRRTGRGGGGETKIQVIVTVAGPALVEAPPSGPIDISLPVTEGFCDPVPLLPNGKAPHRFSIDRHSVVLVFGDEKARSLGKGDPRHLRLLLNVARDGGVDLSALDPLPYVSFEEILPAARSTVRAEVSDLLRRADTRLAQLYRPTTSYEPRSGSMADPLYTLFSRVAHAHETGGSEWWQRFAKILGGGYIAP